MNYNNHLNKKKNGSEEKTKDEEESGPETAVYTIDAQAVLVCHYWKAPAPRK